MHSRRKIRCVTCLGALGHVEVRHGRSGFLKLIHQVHRKGTSWKYSQHCAEERPIQKHEAMAEVAVVRHERHVGVSGHLPSKPSARVPSTALLDFLLQ